MLYMVCESPYTSHVDTMKTFYRQLFKNMYVVSFYEVMKSSRCNTCCLARESYTNRNSVNILLKAGYEKIT